MTIPFLAIAVGITWLEAKTHLSRLLERVAIGEEVIIAKAGTPVAKLVPVESARKEFRFGSAKGEFVVPDDFNESDAEIERLFYKGDPSHEGPLDE